MPVTCNADAIANETINANATVVHMEWVKNAEELWGAKDYKKHLIRQTNRILLRLRQLFYLKPKLIGDDNAAKIDKDESPTPNGGKKLVTHACW